jgi:hypothetical protein
MRSEATWHRAAVALILLLGAALRSLQYGALPALWWDELAIALNVGQRGWSDLLIRPLDHFQVAPIGFLLLEKTAVTTLGNNEAGLRFFPYLLSLIALVLFWRVSTRYLRTGSMLAALLAFALSPTLSLYAGTVKQYSGDVAITLFLLLLALRYLEDAPANAAAGIAGGISILASHPAVLVATGLTAWLWVATRRAQRATRSLIVLCGGWLAGAALLTLTSLASRSGATDTLMTDFWSHGFVPAPWKGVAELVWIPARLLGFLAFFVASMSIGRAITGLALGVVYGALLAIGIPYLIRRNLSKAGVLAVPVVVALCAATVRLLPFGERVSLFVGPSLLIACFAGFDGFRAWLPRLGRVAPASAVALAAVPGVALLLLRPPPVVWTESRLVLQEMAAHHAAGDRLVMFRWLGEVSTEYYGGRFGLEGWARIEPIQGRHPAERVVRSYLHGVDEFRGVSRTWFYFDGTTACEEQTILGYLDAIGRRVQGFQRSVKGGVTVSAYLYDLSDPDLLREASADDHPLSGVCGGTVA